MSSSNKHEPIRRPPGEARYWHRGETHYGKPFEAFYQAADKLFADLEHLNSLPYSVERETKAEHVQTAITAMHAAVSLLGIEPLVIYMAGRCEQMDVEL